MNPNEYVRPHLGICADRENSPRKNYGTRTHTVIVVENNGDATFIEEDRYLLKQPVEDDGGLNIEQGAWRNDFEFKIDSIDCSNGHTNGGENLNGHI